MLVPRIVMMAIIVAMSIILPVIYTSLVFKWWALLAVVLLIFAIATPDYLVDDKWDTTFYKTPLIIMKSIPGLSNISDFLDHLEFKKNKKDKEKRKKNKHK